MPPVETLVVEQPRIELVEVVETAGPIADFSGTGTRGLVPDPDDELDRFLRDDGEWAFPAGGGGGGSGDVVGPASAVDEVIARFNGTTGKLVQSSQVAITDAGNVTLPGGATVDGRDVSVDGAKLDGIEAFAAAPPYVEADLANGAVSNAKLADAPQSTLKGRPAAGGTGAPMDLTASQARTLLNVEDGATADQAADEVPFAPAGAIAATDVQAAIEELDAEKAATGHSHSAFAGAGTTGFVPDPVTATGSEFLRDDGIWAVPAGGGGGSGDVVGPASATDEAVARYNGTTGKLLQGSGVTITDAGSVSIPSGQTVDGRDLSVDGTKLDGIEAGAIAPPFVEADLADGAVTNAKLADMAQSTLKGRAAGAGTGDPTDLTASQARTLLNVEDGAAADQVASEVPFTPTGAIAATNVQTALAELDTEKAAVGHTHPDFVGSGASGFVPDPGTETGKVLSDDGTWVTPAGGDVVGPASSTDNAVARFDGTTGKLIQNSLVTISDAGSISLAASQTVDGRDVSVDGTKLDGIETAATADQIASEVPFTPAGNIAATNVQAALQELDTEKAATSAIPPAADTAPPAVGTQTLGSSTDYAREDHNHAIASSAVGTSQIANDAVDGTKLANMAQATIKGRQAGAGTGDPEDLTATQARTILNVADGAIANVVEDTSPQLGGELDCGEHTIGSTERANTLTAGAVTIDWRLSNSQLVTLSANATLTFTAPTKPSGLRLRILQNGTGGWTLTLPTIKWPGGVAPFWSVGANDVDLLSLYYDGSAYYGMAALDFL